ncbi:hypothetical protein [Coprococcus catus]|uniref:hypothetical protein n=1 Tax=Coprococcus catus TaxID=116085 RepID=UPI003D05AAB6
MDKYEYRIKTEQMLKYAEEKSYRKAMEIADTIDWRKVKNSSMLSTVSEIYENMGELQKAKEILFIAYDKAPTSRKIVYRLGLLSLKSNELDEAMDCYEEFVKMAPKDPNQHILKYKILRAQNAPITQQIEALEDFKHAEYVEKWAYELAKLYHEAGMTAECLEECDDLILWFSEGTYVYQAMELKMKYKPLTPLQQEKYDSRFAGEKKEPVKKKPMFKKPKERPAPDPRIAQKIRENVHVTGSIDLPDLPEPMAEIVSPDLESLPDERPVPPRPRTKIENTSEIVTTISGSNLADVLKAGVAVASGVDVAAQQQKQDDPQVTGQMKIEEILANWEVTQRENAKIIEKNEEEKKRRKAARKQEEESLGDTKTILADDIRRLMEELENGTEPSETLEDEEKDGITEEYEDDDVENMGNVVESLQLDDDDDEYEDAEEYEEEEYEDAEEYEEEVEEEDEYEDAEEYEEEEYEDAEEYEEEVEEEDEYEDAEAYEEEEYEDAEEYEEEVEEEDEYEDAEAYEEEVEEEDEYEDAEAYEEEEYEDAEEYEEEVEGEDEYEDAEAYEEEEYEDAEEYEEEVEEEDEYEDAEEYEEEEYEDAEEYEDEVEYEDDKYEDAEEYEEEEYEDAEEYEEEEYEDAEEYEEEEYEDAEEYEEEEYEDAEEYEEDEYEDAEEYAEEEYEDDEYEEEYDELEDEYLDEKDVYELDIDAILEAQKKSDSAEDPEFAINPDFDIELESETDSEPASKKRPRSKRPEQKQEVLEIEEPSEEEITSRMNKFDTGFIVQGRYDLSATSEIGLKAGLTEEQKKLFSYFVPIRGVSEQLVEVLDNDKRCKNRYGTSRTGNIVVVGKKGTGKTVLAVDIVKAIQKQRKLKQGKVAIITGDSLNKKELGGIIRKLNGGALIIEKAAKMNARTVNELNDLMDEQTGELLFVLEEQKKPLEKLFAANPNFKKKFTSRLELPVFINDELVTFGQTYAKENGYRIDEMGILALYSRIDMMQREDHAVTVAEVKEIMDEAIEHSQKANVKHLMKRVFGKNKDDSDRVILKEEDFKL